MLPKKIFISAIETSGDLHAAQLVRALKKQNKNLIFYGIGSEALKAEGAEIFLDLTHRSTVGIIEPLRHLGAYLRALRRVKKILRREKFALFLCVDGQGFHLPVAAYAKKQGIPVAYYISPQEWLWGTASGGRKVAWICDLIISIFPEEKAFYQKLGTHAVYNGHPLSEIVKTNVSPRVFRQKHKLAADKPLVAFFPGSRRQELDNLLPVFAKMVKLSGGREQFVTVAASEYCYRRLLREIKNVPVLYKENYAAIAAADIVVSSTGTITLEAALLGTPIIAVYKFPPLSYWLVSKLLGHKIPKYKALPNMLAGREIMPERIQDFTAESLYALLTKTLSDQKKLRQIKQDFRKLKTKLTAKDVLAKNAREVLKLL